MSRRLRVCFVVESGTDVRLVDGLAERCDLTVFARRIEGGVEISRAPAHAVRVDVGPPRFAGFARAAHAYVRAHRDRFDIAVVQGYGAAAAAVNLAGRSTRLPSVMLVCSPVEAYYRCRRAARGFGKPFRGTEYAMLLAAAAINARMRRPYVVLSSYLERVVRGHGATARVDVIPVYGVDTTVFANATGERAALRRQRGLPETGSLLFFSSRVAPEKDSETLLAAVRRLRGQGRDVRILHRSGGYRRFEEDARRAGLADAVHVSDAVHPIRELPGDYAACDVCVQASHEEGLGFSVLEALACGVPVVATRVGGLAETIVEGETGWTCPPGDAAAMADAIADVLDRPDEGRRRAAVGRDMVRARFERTAVFDRFMQVLGEHAGAHP